ncbi:MAG: WYL domain-containing protein [Microbacteriaceae bacterium]
MRIPVEERLFSLVLALLASEGGLSKADILSTVQGYRQDYRPGGDNANLERKFERDKDDLRELGVPLETTGDAAEPGNNQLLRYRIPRGAYELPEDVRFSPEEQTLLDLAARVWAEGSVSAQSRRALVKLRALGAAGDEPLIGYAPRVRVRDAAFEPLSEALDRRQWVRFAYLKPGEAVAREREVAPLALVLYQGRWHLAAEEAGSGATKTFLLRRIVGAVTATGRGHDIPLAGQKERALAELDDVWRRCTARVRVEPGTDAAARLARRRGTVELPDGSLELHYIDANILADELAGFGPEVLVLAPAELVAAVHSRLEQTARTHAD